MKREIYCAKCSPKGYNSAPEGFSHPYSGEYIFKVTGVLRMANPNSEAGCICDYCSIKIEPLETVSCFSIGITGDYQPWEFFYLEGNDYKI